MKWNMSQLLGVMMSLSVASTCMFFWCAFHRNRTQESKGLQGICIRHCSTQHRFRSRKVGLY